jgi:hypothetical protein
MKEKIIEILKNKRMLGSGSDYPIIWASDGDIDLIASEINSSIKSECNQSNDVKKGSKNFPKVSPEQFAKAREAMRNIRNNR